MTTKYTLEQELYEGYWQAEFAFDATSQEDAEKKAYYWARYHSFPTSTVRVREATENEAVNWLHNEYIEFASCGR